MKRLELLRHSMGGQYDNISSTMTYISNKRKWLQGAKKDRVKLEAALDDGNNVEKLEILNADILHGTSILDEELAYLKSTQRFLHKLKREHDLLDADVHLGNFAVIDTMPFPDEHIQLVKRRR